MRILFVMACFLVTSFGFSQEEANVEDNKVTTKQVAPVWPGCEDSNDKKTCFNQELMAHVKENYEYPKNDDGDYVRGKATIKMEINEEGEVVVHSVEGPEPMVNQAAEEMINKIPKMKPGSRAGEPASIKYTIPLNF